MGMPITVEVLGAAATPAAIVLVFACFTWVDQKFSTYKAASAISRINAGQLTLAEAGADMRTVFQLTEQTRQEIRRLLRQRARRALRHVRHPQRLGHPQCRRAAARQRSAQLLRRSRRRHPGRRPQASGLAVANRHPHPLNVDEIVKVVAEPPVPAGHCALRYGREMMQRKAEVAR
jgi:hypothetical protein